MLKLGGALAVSSDSSPVVRPSDILVHSCVDHGFDGEDVADLHEACGLVASVVRDVRSAMEEVADSMPTVCTVNR